MIEDFAHRLVLDRIESDGRWERVRGYRPLPAP